MQKCVTNWHYSLGGTAPNQNHSINSPWQYRRKGTCWSESLPLVVISAEQAISAQLVYFGFVILFISFGYFIWLAREHIRVGVHVKAPLNHARLTQQILQTTHQSSL